MTVPCKLCGVMFTPNRAWQTHCTPKCRDNSPKNREKTRLFQLERRDKINAIKIGAGCATCGYAAHPSALDFNHISGEKLFDVSQDPKRSWAATLLEIAKCEVLCANCHRIHTYNERHWHTKRAIPIGAGQ